MTTLEMYRELVREAILRRTGEAILNGNTEHATIITEEALSHAEKRVRILSHKLDQDCYGRRGVLNAARFFLSHSDHRLEILVEASLWDPQYRQMWSQHPLIRELRGMPAPEGCNRPGFDFGIVPGDLAQKYKFNFLLLDDYGFRFEADRALPGATAAFFPEGNNNPAVTNLENIFDQLWNGSTKVDIWA